MHCVPYFMLIMKFYLRRRTNMYQVIATKTTKSDSRDSVVQNTTYFWTL